MKAAELYVPATNQSCILPDLPTSRFYHSQVGLRACGGRTFINDSTNNSSPDLRDQEIFQCDKTCDTWNPETGSWAEKDVSLIGCRADNSWTPEQYYPAGVPRGEGTYLIGGYGWWYGNTNGNTSEGWENTETTDFLKPDGTVIPGFNLNTTTQYANQFYRL